MKDSQKLEGVDMIHIDLPEIQGDTVAEICRAKIAEAFRLAPQMAPLVVQDSGFAIHALRGFPGPYTKYVLSTIGVDGLLKLMEGETDRRCGFVACVGHADAEGEIHIFEEPRQYFGTLSERRSSTRPEGDAVGRAWGGTANQLFEVFIPDDANCGELTLGEMSEEQLTSYRRERDSAFKAFARWWEKAH